MIMNFSQTHSFLYSNLYSHNGIHDCLWYDKASCITALPCNYESHYGVVNLIKDSHFTLQSFKTLLFVWPHEVEPWFHFIGRVETLDQK